MLETNQILRDRYRIVRQIGHGGMGAVYEALDEKRFNKPVALKEILIDLDKIPNHKQREQIQRAFEREAEILTRIDYEAFPEVIEYFAEGDRQFLVMKLIDGKNLEKLLKDQKSFFPLADVLDWTRQLLDALDYLHTMRPHPIYHRDIKPPNLKLTERGKIKLLDFGIAKAADLNGASTNSTFIGITYSFSPLEQCLRIPNQNYFEAVNQGHLEKISAIQRQTIDARCDLYSLGATVYNLLTNQLPPNAVERALDAWAGKSDPLVAPNSINTQIPPEMSDAILKAMAIERDDRFASAKEMAAALDIHLPENQARKTQFQFVEEDTPSLKAKAAATTHLMPTLRTGDGEEMSKKEEGQFPEKSVIDPENFATVAAGSSTAVAAVSPRPTLFFDNPRIRSRVVWFAPLAVILFGFIGTASYFSLKSPPSDVIKPANTNVATAVQPTATPTSETSEASNTTTNNSSATPPLPIRTQQREASVKKPLLSAGDDAPARKRENAGKQATKPRAKKPVPVDRMTPP